MRLVIQRNDDGQKVPWAVLAFNTAGPAGEGGALPPLLPTPWLTEGRLSLSLSHFYILKSGYTLLNLEEALFGKGIFHLQKHRQNVLT